MFSLRLFVWRIIDAYQLLIVIDAVTSWIPRTPGSFFDQICSAISGLTDPFVNLFRRMIPSMGAGGVSLDFSPMLAIIVLDVLKRII